MKELTKKKFLVYAEKTAGPECGWKDFKNSLALVGEWPIPIERLQLVGEISANFCG
jgi:hypothetical protein